MPATNRSCWRARFAAPLCWLVPAATWRVGLPSLSSVARCTCSTMAFSISICCAGHRPARRASGRFCGGTHAAVRPVPRAGGCGGRCRCAAGAAGRTGHPRRDGGAPEGRDGVWLSSPHRRAGGRSGACLRLRRHREARTFLRRPGTLGMAACRASIVSRPPRLFRERSRRHRSQRPQLRGPGDAHDGERCGPAARSGCSRPCRSRSCRSTCPSSRLSVRGCTSA